MCRPFFKYSATAEYFIFILSNQPTRKKRRNALRLLNIATKQKHKNNEITITDCLPHYGRLCDQILLPHYPEVLEMGASG